MSAIYKVKEWNKYYENNRSRQISDLTWVPIPNGHDGDGFCLIMEHTKSAELFAAWILILQVASRCAKRGILVRDNGKPHTPESLAARTRSKPEWFSRAIPILLEIGWLTVETTIPQEGDAQVTPTAHLTDEEGIERKEGKKEAKCYPPNSRACVHYLNERAGRNYRETDQNLKTITERLSEEGITIEGIKKMIDRQCALWKTDPKMCEYLTIDTLFGKRNFGKYYDNREQPLKATSGAPGRLSNAEILKEAM